MRLKGKIAVVTAAGQGIGRAVALAMAREGAHVWATDANAGLLDSCGQMSGIDTAQLNVRDKAAMSAFFAARERVDILFNCAGFVHNGTVLEATDDEWTFAFELNVRAQYWAIQQVIPKMLAQGGGSIVNMASVASSLRGLPNRFIYGTTKAAVVGLTKAVAADYVKDNIRCNAISPGTVQTPSLEARLNSYDDPLQARAQFVSRQPMGRIAMPEEIAPLVVFLASDEATFVTGQNYSVDGGMTI
ncbi:SDR family oxidoreductase [Burkholderia cenocepacia]|uniref:SDR family oxidoreductase n=1 Tax=Burkholderia cenocepacia TaxID=95486 RepID=A0ABD4UPD3_9BURK|nr:SDR family oxidoreductase [Burkholderia cenocepacia]MCW3698571.1 SDR family oxidoreductase [Burkholderia cenocepacia]MCW3708147.1 SDR family oxidoreductase [Burkholderia cenocepacia]MCW3716207.1 SDR family oxidoreductase [Burkholderia cenocepacia]MCW3724262.1 SDR family oxidoreductase [Burkholderia cenocepacia]MCW3732349.1 SDR family oxidoreductase [Burkholderia cenocepacia]